jgi:hypothetical protein
MQKLKGDRRISVRNSVRSIVRGVTEIETGKADSREAEQECHVIGPRTHSLKASSAMSPTGSQWVSSTRLLQKEVKNNAQLK